MVKNTINNILAVLIAFCLSLGLWLLGFVLHTENLVAFAKNKSAIIVILIALCAILVALAVYNITTGKKMNKKFAQMKMDEKQEFSLEEKARVEKDQKQAEIQVAKRIKLFNLYKICVLVLLYLLCFFVGLGAFSVATVFVLLCIFLSWGIVLSLFSPAQNDVANKKLFIDKTHFPYIFSVIEKAGKSMNYTGKISAIFSNGGISIGNSGKGVIITLPAEIVALLTEEELYSVMIHEFAHFKNQDTHLREKLYSFIERHQPQATSDNPILEFGKFIFLSGHLGGIILSIVSYDTFSSREKESIADNAVKETGLCQAYINATAKSVLFGIYSEYPWREITFDTYESTSPVLDYTQRNYNCFLEKVALYGDKWHFTLKNELPARVDSHPTLKARMQALSVSEYYTEYPPFTGDYGKEQQKLIEEQGKIAVEINYAKDKHNALYTLQRKNAYTERQRVIDKYNALTEWDKVSDSELIECAQAFLFIEDNKAEKILREVIERSNSSYACYLLACYYSREYNDECIELFKRSALDSTATDEAFDQLGKYALKTGNQALLDEYRATVASKNQNAVDELQETLFSKEGLIAPTATHQEVVSEITSRLCEYWGNNLSALYVAVRETQNTTVYYVAIEVIKKAEQSSAQQAYDESCYFINRMSKAGKKFYLYFVGKEFNAIKRLPNTCQFKRK